MKKNFWIALALVIVLAAAFMSYGVYLNYSDEVTIANRMANRHLTISASIVKEREIKPEYIAWNVKLEAEHSFDVIAKTNGVIKENYLHKNKRVSPGDVLAVLENEELPLKISSAESMLKKAQALVVQTKTSYDRYSKLALENATSLEKLDEAKANYEAALASEQDARAQYNNAIVNMDRLKIISPSEGSVLVIYKQEGSFISAGTPICMVADFRRMWFAINMPDNEIKALLGNYGLDSTFYLTSKAISRNKPYSTEYGDGNEGMNSKFDVYLQGIYPSIDVPAKMRRVALYVDNSNAILEPHIYSVCRLIAKNSRNALTVDKRSVFGIDDGQRYLFVVNDNMELEKREVVIGASDSKYLEIISGVHPGERVVISGFEGLSKGQKVEIGHLEEN